MHYTFDIHIVSMFIRYTEELQPIFKIDPLLLRLFVKVVALEDLHLLIAKVPTSILLMRLVEESTNENQVAITCLLIP